MSLRTIILRNNSNKEVLVADIGWVVMPEETNDISDQFPISQLSESADLKNFIQNKVFTINDGEKDLEIDDALAFITVETAYEAQKRFNNFVEKKNEKYTGESQFVTDKPSKRKITILPIVFQVPENTTKETDLVAVMMPFNAAFDSVHEGIRRACSAAGYRCLRVDDIWEESTVIQDIFNLIFRSQVVVVDFTGKNPNVMYETGIAHTLGKHVVPIAQSSDDVPFDIAHHRFLKYLPNGEGIECMVNKLTEKLLQGSTRRITNGETQTAGSSFPRVLFSGRRWAPNRWASPRRTGE